ncbi:hypothetical protein HYC85_005834 [Camellia sinensis]|uniref:DEUBAD domain-containing protein n=1 Tax=Camellia sinensis TaxID=4442 RepID=A0A7J7I104_CAMSI|nr:hypothetical protein HYC85_005834 [Camellia sinensis]
MAADQRKKRLTTASVTSFQEKGREKKKKFGLLQCDLNVRSNISLKWDDKRKSVVAKREQISLKRRDLIPFIDYVPHCHNILADVLVVPHEIFELDNLKEVLSYEVWKTHLSENERNYLMQFLPMGAEMHQVVQELFAGDNFHFGNPFIKWGDSLCSGNLHPDAVLPQEQCFKTSKKSYYSELKKYHKGMVGNLLTWKETWASCKDPEKEIVRKIWRSRKQVERNMSTDANDYRFHDAEDDFAAMSESGSWATDEKAGSSSDDQNLMRKHGELQTRLQLVNRDLPVAFANWRTWQIKKWQMVQSLDREIEENLKSVKEDEEKETALNMLLDLTDNRAADFEATITVEVEEKGTSDSLIQEHIDDGAENHNPDIALEDIEKENPDTVVQGMTDNEAAKHNQHLQPIPSLNGRHEFSPMDLDSDNNVNVETDDIPHNVSEYAENLNHVDIAVSQGDPLSSTSYVRPAVGMPDSYYHCTSLNHDCTSAHELSIGHPRILKSNWPDGLIWNPTIRKKTQRKLCCTDNPLKGPCFNPYTDKEVEDRNELLQHFFKAQDGLPYRHEQKQKGLDFLPETGQFSGHVGQHLHPSVSLDLRQKRLNELYMHQNIQEKMFSDVGRYTIPRQEHFTSVNVQDWAVSTTHMAVPLQSHLSGGELDRTWFLGEHSVHGSWSSLDAVGPTQSIGNRSNADQSLFSVVSQCNDQLHPGAPYDSMRSTEQFIQVGTYGGLGALVPTASNALVQAVDPLDYLSGRETTATTVKNKNIGWMRMPPQNSALQDSLGKTFLSIRSNSITTSLMAGRLSLDGSTQRTINIMNSPMPSAVKLFPNNSSISKCLASRKDNSTTSLLPTADHQNKSWTDTYPFTGSEI